MGGFEGRFSVSGFRCSVFSFQFSVLIFGVQGGASWHFIRLRIWSWKLSCRLAIRVYEDLRACKDFGLKDQMTRAAVSIASNIAQGSERATGPDFVRFLNIAKGSAAGLRTQTCIAARIGILNDQQQHQLTTDLKQISAMLHALCKTIHARPSPKKK